MTERRFRNGRGRWCGRIDRDLLDWLNDYAQMHGVGSEIFVEAAVAEYRERYERDRDNPRADSTHEE